MHYKINKNENILQKRKAKRNNMEIEKIKINQFGKIKDKEIQFDKINLIYGKNESGKSTLLNFIISMLYGISKNKSGKKYTDFEKFYPWNKEEFSGIINYKLETLKRRHQKYMTKMKMILHLNIVQIKKMVINFLQNKLKQKKKFQNQQ